MQKHSYSCSESELGDFLGDKRGESMVDDELMFLFNNFSNKGYSSYFIS